MPESRSASTIRFGPFEVNRYAGELRKHGIRIRLSGQPFEVLTLLLKRPGEVVTYEELRAKLWQADTFVDFEHGLHAAVNKLREALGDSAKRPRYVQTLPRRGYRFVAPVQSGAEASEAPPLALGEKQAAPEQMAASASVAQRFWALGRPVATRLGIAVSLAALGVGYFSLRHWRQPSPAAALRIQSLAVLPLENLSRDPEQEYFVDGMTDELITNLAKIGALRVISRTSVMRYKGTKKSLPEIARELNVDAVVEGTVSRSPGRVHITAQLVLARPEKHLWAEGYDRPLGDAVALQSELARTIATEIKIKATPQEQARLSSARPVNPQAYELYLWGKHYWQRELGVSQAGSKSIGYFQKAIALDPNYAPAYAGLARTYISLLPATENMPKARALAMKAMEFDETLAEAHVALADIKFLSDWDWAGAGEEFQRALELNPGAVGAHADHAMYLWAMGRGDEATAELQRAQQLDPLSLSVNLWLGRSFYFAHDFDRAIEQYRKTIELDPTYSWAHLFLAIAYHTVGNYDQAVEEMSKARELQGDREFTLAVGKAYKRAGYAGALRVLAEDTEHKWRRGQEQAASLALIYAKLDKEKAFMWLEKAYQERSRALPYLLRADPQFDNLRPDPRYADLLRRLSLPS